MLKRKGEIMSVFRVEKNNNYTVMANYHLRDKELSFKAKGYYPTCLVYQKTGIIH